MKKRKLNYRFHNPNTREETADYIAKLFVEVNKNKIERVLQEEADKIEKEENEKEHSA
ncbi:MAG: hypothetical protein ACI4AD_07745 [Roseburia sp.]